MDPDTKMPPFFFTNKPHGSSLKSVTYKQHSNLHSNARLSWEPLLTGNEKMGNAIPASLNRGDRRWYSVKDVAVVDETNNGSNHAQLTMSITLPSVPKSLITSNNLIFVMIGTFMVMNSLKRRTMKFLQSSPDAEVIVGPLKDSVAAVEKVVPTWVSGIISFVLLSVAVFGKLKEKDPIDVSFKDVIGIDAVIPKFLKILSYLPPNISLHKPDGFLVYGPQRTGKTTLIHALAKQSGLPFFPMYASDIAKVGTQEIKKLFSDARRSSPSIVLIENIESIAAKRESGESDPILLELRKEMDLCKRNKKEVSVIATTDKFEKLDLFLTKNGWFNHQVYVPRPDADGRRKMVNYLLKGFMREEDEEPCNLIVSKTQDLVWGNIEHVCGLVSTYAKDKGNTHVTMEDVHRAFEELAGNVNSEYAGL